MRLTHAEVERCRRKPGESVLLFITDRCPVGCAHCSVDSKSDSPTISNFDLFAQLLDGICEQTDLQVVGISGGEPFAERRGLTLACQRFAQAGKTTVIYTSGVWAKTAQIPAWIENVLKSTATVYLSTDSFHQSTVKPDAFVRAAQTIAACGAWVVVQTLDAAQASALLEQAFDGDYTPYAEVVPITPLTNGRGGQVFVRTKSLHGESFGACHLAVTPVVRYDGAVKGCCNESVIMGHGPKRLHQQTACKTEMNQALRFFQDDPVLRCVAGVGLGALTAHPALRELADKRFLSNCDLCWKVMDHFPQTNVTDKLLHAIAELEATP